MPFTIASLVRFEEDVKKSRFEAIAVPVENEQAVKDFLEANKNGDHYPSMLGHGKLAIRCVLMTDGETFWHCRLDLILATIEGNELTNVLVLVNRWYGGDWAWHRWPSACLWRLCRAMPAASRKN
ncbi:YigZ family protein [Acinetobacter indicus]